MSSYYQIFLRAPEMEVQQVIADIAVATECELSPVDSAVDGIDFAGGGDTAKFQVELSHEFDDDYGIAFSRYPIVITAIDSERTAKREEALARRVFRKLAEKDEYSMILVLNLSVLIDRYGA